ncbi:MAG: hypothetical protein QOG42_1855, partial [Solirubrobacteraceae bacterium]|nr:hypothetical protein [Solirubrobacteraceae bacterium]
MSAARQAPPPRAGSGPREPAGARRSRGAASGPARMARAPLAGARQGLAPRREPHASGEGAPLEPPRRLSGWQLLLEELNRLLRDPTLTRALK